MSKKRNNRKPNNKKSQPNMMETRTKVEYFQPWSNMICKVQLPKLILDDLLNMYTETMEGEWENFGKELVGQINQEPKCPPEILMKYPRFGEFCLQCVGNFVHTQISQNIGGDHNEKQGGNAKFLNMKDLVAKINSMWFVRQKPNEYNPVHFHTNCRVSAVMYLKTPKNQIKNRKDHYQTDGCITFTNNTGTDTNFAKSMLTIKPEVGDMYIFGAKQNHMVWPYRSTDPDDLRVSLSFNADFASRKQLEELGAQIQAGNVKNADGTVVTPPGVLQAGITPPDGMSQMEHDAILQNHIQKNHTGVGAMKNVQDSVARTLADDMKRYEEKNKK